MGWVATSLLPPWGMPTASEQGQNQKWHTSGLGGYIAPAASGSPPLHSTGQNQQWQSEVEKLVFLGKFLLSRNFFIFLSK